MSFAPTTSDLSYWQKQSEPLFPDLFWNIPEQKTGHIAVVGGNGQSFSTVIRTAEYLDKTFPFAHVETILPDALRGKLPPLANVEFTQSTTSGSFANSYRLQEHIQSSDATLVIGDISKNAATSVALATAISPFIPENTEKAATSTKVPDPIILTRDSVDSLFSEGTKWLMQPNIILVATTVQLQKLLRAIYYPRMIMLSQPLLPVIETLHKFTLSYPVTILTFHENQIIVAHQGKISTTPILQTNYSPIGLWSGQLASNILAFNLYNPNHRFEATTAAILYH